MSTDKIISKSVTLNNQDITIKVGEYAQQASGAVTVTSGETIVQVTVVAGRENPSLGYFPLSVEYQEKLYAAGIIKGSRWVKREGKPTDDSILKARLIDRSIRPLFPKTYMSEVQVIVSVLSYDQQTNPDILGLIGTSAALSISNIPFQGPIAAVRIGTDQEGNLIINPTKTQLETSKLDLVVSGSSTAIVMVEAGAKEIKESFTVKALKLAGEEIKKITTAIDELVSQIKPVKTVAMDSKIDESHKKQILTKVKTSLDDYIERLKAGASNSEIYEIETAVVNELEDLEPSVIKEVIQDYFNQALRTQLIEKKIRPDGRTTNQVRELSSKVSLLPRTHGSAMFQRGATQALSVVTLGSPSLEMLIEDLDGETSQRYMHHYNFPPFCVGETGRMGWPKRREIGHGALAQRALEPLLPSPEEFPYTIRVVSEIMSSNGSSSMASVCGSTLSLMDAGVPLKKPVAGIAMGLIKQADDYIVLTDIQGLEDHLGDMDFKVAGTKDGITALQMDIKISGIPFEVLETALDQAKIARLTILESMAKTLEKPREQLSVYAPKIATITIPVEKIGELIGPGGRQIKEIIKETECEVNVEDDGRVSITGLTQENLDRAVTWIQGLTRVIQVGEEFDGTVVRVENYGAFVELLPGRDGMVHVSKLSPNFIKNINEVVKVGDFLHVRVAKIDEMNRIDLTTLTPEQEQQSRNQQQSRPQRSSGGRFDNNRPRRPQRY